MSTVEIDQGLVWDFAVFHCLGKQKIEVLRWVQVCVVTGANAGVGLVTARLLAERGAHIIMACRSLSAAEQAATSVRAAACAKDISHPQVNSRMPSCVGHLDSFAAY